MSAPSFAQGSFENLDFEAARIIPIQPPPAPQFYIATSNALPGWNAFSPIIGYDTISLGAAAISIHDRKSLEPVLEGNYSVLLQSSFDGKIVPFISQTGLVPDWAQSVRFLGAPTMSVSLGGQELPIELISDGLCGANIGDSAGKLLELKFSGSGWIDSIAFSPQLIPEPGALTLLFLGAGTAFMRRKGPSSWS